MIETGTINDINVHVFVYIINKAFLRRFYHELCLCFYHELCLFCLFISLIKPFLDSTDAH